MLKTITSVSVIGALAFLPLTINDSTSKNAAESPVQLQSTIIKDNVTPKHVVAISIDGLNPQAIKALGPKKAPTFYFLMNNGVSSLNGRSAFESTSTLPNHTSMLTSRAVELSNGGHGFVDNDDNAKTTIHAVHGSYVSSLFDVAHNRGKTTALYTSKDKFALFDRSYNATNGAKDTVGEDNGRDKIDTYFYTENETKLVDAVTARLVKNPHTITFVHISSTDKVGHASGYMSEAYINAVQAADTKVGKILKTIRANEDLEANTALVLTSDHGGKGPLHSDATKRVNYTIPFFAYGVGVVEGKSIYAMNDHLQNPEAGRPGYKVKQPIRNAMLGNLVLDMLKLPAIPGSNQNAKQNLKAGPGTK